MSRLIAMLAALWVMLALFVWADSAKADQNRPKAHATNEVSLHPMVVGESNAVVPFSWELFYTNMLTHPSTSLQAGSFEITLRDGRPEQIVWQLRRTSNAVCSNLRGGGAKPPEVCADTIRVVPPEGYIAIPDEATVLEGDSLRILIIPATIG